MELRCLDLSDNDIYDVLEIVRPLGNLTNLSSLQLEGNPCSVCETYKDVVLKYLPNLLFLDNTQVLEGDKVVKDQPEIGIENAALVFTCHRIIGLPPPPKQKKLIQTIYFEVNLPLLEEILIEPELTENENVEDGRKRKPKFRLSSSKSSTKKSKKGKKGKKGPQSLYAARNEYADEIGKKVKDTSFKTARVPWSKVITFPEDAIVVQHPENDMKAIRDTFRSNINVKIIYLEIKPPDSKTGKKGKGKAKGQKSKKGKNAKSKDKKSSKKNSNRAENDKTTSKISGEEENPKETILKKITLANFNCELRDINWSDKTVDFYWANHPKANPQAIPVEGCLRSLYYGEITHNDAGRTKEHLPNIFTCHVGFGLKRI